MSRTRTANLASIFQEVLTAVVRVRARLQVVHDSEAFRAQFREFLAPAMQRALALGYSNDAVQAAVFAVVALLDESVLNLQDAAFASWARRPLQEELFGGHLAGETFFYNLHGYLSQPDSPQLADVLELHCLCLLLGYRGRYAVVDSGEMHAMLRQARARIERIRGSSAFLTIDVTEARSEYTRRLDFWSKCLLWTATALASLLLIMFLAYSISLNSGVPALQSHSFTPLAPRLENPSCPRIVDSRAVSVS